MNLIKLNQVGKILDGNYKNWFVLIETDEESKNDEEPGYYVFIAPKVENLTIKQGVYDEYYSSWEELNKLFNYKVDWDHNF